MRKLLVFLSYVCLAVVLIGMYLFLRTCWFVEPTPTVTATALPPTVTATATRTATLTATAEPTIAPSFTATATVTVKPTLQPTHTAIPEPTVTATLNYRWVDCWGQVRDYIRYQWHACP